MKKLLAILLSALMLMSFGFTAFAAGSETAGSITVTNANAGETYTVYKVFDLTYAGNDQTAATDGTMNEFNGTVAYSITETKSNAAFINVLKNGYDEGEVHIASPFTLEKTTVKYVETKPAPTTESDPTSASDATEATVTVEYYVYNVKVDDSYVDATTGEAKPELIKFMKYLASENYLTEVATAKATDTTVKFTDLGLGYYYVTSTMGSVVTIDSTLKDVEIKDKNMAPSVEKLVKEGDAWGKKSDGYSYDHIEYKSTITAYEGVSNLALHDDMPDLYLDQTQQIYFTLSDDTLAALGYTLEESATGEFALIDYSSNRDSIGMPKEYTYLWCYDVRQKQSDGTDKLIHRYGLAYVSLDSAASIGSDYNGFDMLFTDKFTSRIKGTKDAPTTIEILYNGDMRAASKYSLNTEYVNTAWLTYGANQTSEESSVTTTTHGVNIFKFTGAEETALNNAQFELRDAEGNIITVTKLNDGYVVVGNSAVKSAPKNTVTTLISGEYEKYAGYIRIFGLDSGTYTLTETKAPDGYNILTAPVTIKIDENGDAYYQTGTETNAEGNEVPKWSDKAQNPIKVENKSGSELPSTGGIGTTIFYIAGGVLVAGAVVFFIVRRKMNAGDKAK